MTRQHGAAPAAAPATGTHDTTYNLVSVFYHALQCVETSRHYLQDAELAGDQELMQFFRATQAWQQHLATQAKAVLTKQLHQGDGREWNPEAQIWNLTIMA